MGDHEKAGIFSIALTIAVPVALLAGRWADRNDRPFTPLILAAALSSVGLVGMALAGDARATDPVCSKSPLHEQVVARAEADAASPTEALIYRRMTKGG